MEYRDTQLSSAAFDLLVARAIEIDEDGRERLDLVRARAIADELGISTAAWDAALSERVAAGDLIGAAEPSTFHWMQPLVCAGLGLAVGGLAKEGIRLLGPDELYALVIGAGALGIGLYGAWRHMRKMIHILFAAWWLALLTGLTLGFGRLPSAQGLLLVIPLWAGASVAAGAVVRLLRRGAALLTQFIRDTV